MRSVYTFAALLLGLGCLMSGTVSASGQCDLAKLRVGLIEQADCQLDANDLIRAYEMYKSRTERKMIVYTPPKLPNLLADKIRVVSQSGNSVLDGAVRVENTGTVDVPAFKVVVQAEFTRVDDGFTITSQPVTLDMYDLDAGDRAFTPFFSSVAYILIPDPDLDFDVVVRAIVDPQNRVAEQNELDNVTEYVCRIPGFGDGQARPLPSGMEYCAL